MANSLITPEVLTQPIANNGDKNSIPVTNDQSLGLMSQSTGFPAITSERIAEGGKAPRRADFNGAFNLLSQQHFFLQNGGTYTFRQDVSDAIGGYPLNAMLFYVDSSGNVKIVRSMMQNNTSNFVSNPSYIDDGVHWETVIPTQEWIEGNFVNLTGSQNISGVKTFNGGTIPIRTYASYMDSTQAPTEYKEQGIQTFDVNNKRIGAWATSISTNGEIRSFISASREINRQMVYSVLSTHIDQSGNMYAIAPAAPASTDNSNKIPTTSWVNNYVRNTVRTITQTYGNNTNWYRVWSDGFIEQGGLREGTLVGVNISFTHTFTKPFTQVPLVVAKVWSTQGAGYDMVRGITTSNFTFLGQSAGGNYQTNNRGVSWYACGY